MDETYRFRRAETDADADRLAGLYRSVFAPEDVAGLAMTMFRHLPGMEKRHWFIAEDRATGEIAAALALIPWTWEMAGVRLRVAEMGLVGTREAYRGRGLMVRLNREFETAMAEEGFHLSAIQGIPGFYHRLGYHYAVAMENHIDLPLFGIPDPPEGWRFRPAEVRDIPALKTADGVYRERMGLASVRDEADWQYLLTESRNTEYGSTFWLAEHPETGETVYGRVPEGGFGQGLILSEASIDITSSATVALFAFLKGIATEREKPYIRLNLPNKSTPGRTAMAMGAPAGHPYAWQIKIPDRPAFLRRIAPALERRVAGSPFRDFTGTLRLDFYREAVDLTWKGGAPASIEPGTTEDQDHTFHIPPDLFPALALGHRTWRELQHIRPDIFPAPQYLRPTLAATDRSGLLVDVLFPRVGGWIYGRY